MHKRLMVVAVGVASLVLGQTTEEKNSSMHSGHVVVTPEKLKWGPMPEAAIRGTVPEGFAPIKAEVTVLQGDPGKPGPFVVRIKGPDGARIPPHWHPSDENITVLEGTFVLSTGEKYSDSGSELNAGAYALMPQRTWHFGHFKGDTVLQVHGMGPFIINFGPIEAASGSGK